MIVLHITTITLSNVNYCWLALYPLVDGCVHNLLSTIQIFPNILSVVKFITSFTVLVAELKFFLVYVHLRAYDQHFRFKYSIMFNWYWGQFVSIFLDEIVVVYILVSYLLLIYIVLYLFLMIEGAFGKI